MAGSYNRISIIGNVGRDPEVRYTPSGDQVADFSVATSERRTVQGQQQEQTTWFRISAWGKLAEVCGQYLHKGSYVYVEGPLTQREYTDRDGNNRTSLEVRAREIRMLDKRGDAGEGGYQGQEHGDEGGARDTGSRAQQSAPVGDMDDIPF
jgi:single-strand DNA-binding protein